MWALLQYCNYLLYSLIHAYYGHQSMKQEARLLLTDCPTLVHASVKVSLTQNTMKHSLLLRPDFPMFAYLSSNLRPSMRGIPTSYRVHIWYVKIERLGVTLG